jgi:hypothetical protein
MGRCEPTSNLDVPLVAPGSAFVTVRADSDGSVTEHSEQNNRDAVPVMIAVRGVELRQRVFRALDGGAYHVVQAVPTRERTEGESYLITNVVETSSRSIAECLDASFIYAWVGTAGPPLRVNAVRTTVLDLSSPTVRWQPAGSGELRLGNDAAAARVCVAPGCGGSPMTSIFQPTAPVPGGCVAAGDSQFCNGDVADTLSFAFGSVEGDGIDCPPGTQTTTLCFPAFFYEGIPLSAGEAVVFAVPGTEAVPIEGLPPDFPFSAGVVAFAVDQDGDNGFRCDAGGVVGVEVAVVREHPFPTPDPPNTPGPSPTGPTPTRTRG